jgi:hypothetical protein
MALEIPLEQLAELGILPPAFHMLADGIPDDIAHGRAFDLRDGLDVVAPDDVVPTAQAVAASFAGLEPAAHRSTKRRARADLLVEIRQGIDAEFAG